MCLKSEPPKGLKYAEIFVDDTWSCFVKVLRHKHLSGTYYVPAFSSGGTRNRIAVSTEFRAGMRSLTAPLRREPPYDLEDDHMQSNSEDVSQMVELLHPVEVR